MSTSTSMSYWSMTTDTSMTHTTCMGIVKNPTAIHTCTRACAIFTRTIRTYTIVMAISGPQVSATFLEKLDAVGVEGFFDPPPQLPGAPPLLARNSLDAEGDLHAQLGEVINPDDLQIFQQVRGELRVATQLRANLAEHGDGRVHVCVIGHPELQHGIGKIFGHVRDRGDGAVGNHVHAAIGIT